MADFSASDRPGRGSPLAVAACGALLVVAAILPWAGLQASSDLIGGSVASDMRGVDDQTGLVALVAGLLAAVLGVAGAVGRRWIAALALVPGAAALVALIMFVSSPGDRFSVDLGGLLSIEPVLRPGWFAALAAALALTVFAALSVVRRRRTV